MNTKYLLLYFFVNTCYLKKLSDGNEINKTLVVIFQKVFSVYLSGFQCNLS